MAGTVLEGAAAGARAVGPSAHRGLRFGWLIFVALGVQVLALTVVSPHSFDTARALVLLSYVALYPAGLFNLRRPGMAVILAGLSLNFAVILANGGAMPIDPGDLGATPETTEALHASSGYLPFSKDVARTGEQTRLRLLRDVFPLPGPVNVAFSIGDVFILAGIVGFVVAPIRPRYRSTLTARSRRRSV